MIAAIVRHRTGVLVVALVLTVVAAWRASRLQLDSDLRTLMPGDHPVIVQLDRVERAFGQLGSLVVVVQGSTPAGRRALADAMAERLGAHPMVEAVDHRVEAGFVHDHALYYLSVDDMEALRRHVDAWQHHALCSRAPDLCLTEPDPGAPERLEAFLREQQDRLDGRLGQGSYYDDPRHDALVVFIHPDRPSSDVEFDIAVTRAVREGLERLVSGPGPWSGSDVRTVVVGPYAAKADETLGLRRDVVRSGVVALVGVTVVLLVVFGSARALLVLLVPLGVGVTWSLAAAELMLGHLGVMTSLISTVIMGLGIDTGIHLTVRFRHERRTHEGHEAIVRAFGHLLRPLLVAAGTTACAFAVLISSEFVGFREFGLIAAVGVGLCLLAMVTVFPALLAVVDLGAGRDRAVATSGRRLLGHPALGLGLGVGLSVVALVGAAELREQPFERSSRRLQSDRVRRVHEPALQTMVEVFGKQVHTAVLVVDDYPMLVRTYRSARERHQARRARGDSVVAELVAAPDLLPPEEVDLEQRHEEITELADSLTERTWALLEGRTPVEGRAALDPELGARLRRMLKAQPFGPDDLPAHLLRRLRGRDGSWAIHAHPDFDPADMVGGIALIEETADYTLAEGGGVYVGETILYASMVLLMKDEWPRVLALAVGLVVVFVAVQLRSVSRTLVTLLPVGLGMLWLLGLMGFVGLRFSLFNLGMLPVIVGIGVDHGVYLCAGAGAGVGAQKEADRALALEPIVRAILASTVTTMVGFGAFCVADSAGLRGIGWLAMGGIGLVMVAAVTVVPVLLRGRGMG